MTRNPSHTTRSAVYVVYEVTNGRASLPIAARTSREAALDYVLDWIEPGVELRILGDRDGHWAASIGDKHSVHITTLPLPEED